MKRNTFILISWMALNASSWLPISAANPLYSHPFTSADEVPTPMDTMVYVRRATELPSIQVAGQRIAYTTKGTTQQIFTLNQADIRRSGSQTTADLLQNTGLVAVQKSQQGGGSPVLRGFEASRVLLVLDGIRMNNLIYRSGHLQNIISIDPFSLDRVDVLQGPASLSYGSDALGGTMSFTTGMPRTRKWLAPRHTGNAVIRYGSANNEGTTHFQHRYEGKKWGTFTSVTYTHYDDLKEGKNRNPFLPKDDDYIHSLRYVRPQSDAQDIIVENESPTSQRRSGYDQVNLIQKILFEPTRENSHLLSAHFTTTSEISRYDRLSLWSEKNGTIQPKFAEWYYGPALHALVSYQWKRETARGNTFLNTLAYQHVNESRNDRKYQATSLFHNDEKVDILTWNTDWDIHKNGHLFHFGTDFNLNFLNSKGTEENIVTKEVGPETSRYPDGHNHMLTAEAFLMHRWTLNPYLYMNEGVRAGYSEVYSTVNDLQEFPFFGDDGTMRRRNGTYSLSWGMNYHPVKVWNLSTTLATAYRVPNVDNTSKVFDSKAGTVTIPNADLKPEKTVGLELNSSLSTKGIEWNQTVYATYFYDAIVTQRGTWQGGDYMDYHNQQCLVYRPTNAKRAFLWGTTGQLTLRPCSQVEFSGSCTYTYGRIIENGKLETPLDHIPPLFGKMSVRTFLPKKLGDVTFYTLFNGKKSLSTYNPTGEDNLSLATELGENGQGTPAWYTLNISANLHVARYITLQPAIENITDVCYRTFASGINASGRSYRLTMQVKW